MGGASERGLKLVHTTRGLYAMLITKRSRFHHRAYFHSSKIEAPDGVLVLKWPWCCTVYKGLKGLVLLTSILNCPT